MNKRSNKPWLILAAVVAVALLGWLWSSGDSATDPEKESMLANAGAGPGGAAKSPVDLRSGGSRDDGLSPLKAGRGSVGGTVTDEQGKPIAKATVCAHPYSAEIGGRDRKPKCVQAEANGRYRIEGLFPVPYFVDASAPRFLARSYEKDRDPKVRITAGSHRKGIDIQLEGGAVEFSGVVKDISGGVIEGAMVQTGRTWARGANNGTAFTQTDEEGRFSLWARAGSQRVLAQAEGYSQRSERGRVPGYEFEIFLTPESVLVGRVVSASDGTPVEGVRIKPEKWTENLAFTDADGHFRVEGLSPGRYKPSAQGSHGYGEAVESVQLGLGETSESVEIVLHPAALIEGTVVLAGPDGTPCKDANATLVNSETKESHRGIARPEGVIVFKGVLPGKYEPSVSCKGYVAREDYDPIEVGTESIDGLVWKVDEGRSLSGRVVGAPSEALARGTVKAEMTDAPARAQRTSQWGQPIEPDGSFKIEGLLPGKYKLTANVPDHPPLPEPVEATISEAADTADIEITLSAGGAIRGVVKDEDGVAVVSADIRAKGPSRRWQSVNTDDAGAFEITGMQPGEYRVTAQRGWGENMRKPGTSDDDVQGESAVVVAGEVAEVELLVESRGASIAGTVVDEDGGPIPDAFIRAERESDSAAAAASGNRASARWGGGWNAQPVLTDADGAFTIDGLSEGKYTVQAFRRGGGEGFTEHVDVGSTDARVEISPTGRISGKAVLADGSIPDQFKVTIRDKETEYSRTESYFRTGGLWSADELPPGTFTISVDASDAGGEAKVPLAEGENKDGIEVELTAKVTVTGSVVDLETGEPIPGYTVTMKPRTGGFSFSGRSTGDKLDVTDEQGKFEVASAPVGRVQIVLMPASWEDEDYSLRFMHTTIGNENPFELPPLKVAKSRVKRREQPGDLGWTLKQAEAEQEWEEAPLQVGVVRPGGPAAEAGIEVGDVIEKVDGHDVTGDQRSAFGTLTRAPAGTKLRIGLVDKEDVTLIVGKPL